jgi:hypothetical protein
MATQPAKTVHTIHFEDFDGAQFERLVFAYHARTDKWRSLEWYGQVGSDLGRDIWGIRDDDSKAGESVCIQCVNRTNLTFAKAEADIAKVLTAPNGVPVRFRIVARSNVSADMRDRIKKYATSRGIRLCDVWAGPEFEEFLRAGAESLLKRFIEGEVFPDAPPDLRAFAAESIPLTDQETLALMARLFDRPAFYTPIHQESSLPAFKQAITDTIQALGTGIWKARDGQVIARIPSRHHLKDSNLQKKIRTVERALAQLRAKFDEMMQSGGVRHCGCQVPDCPLYFMDPEVAGVLEHSRRTVLDRFRDAYPAFECHPAW